MIAHAKDHRLHLVGIQRPSAGRPLDLTKPAEQLRQAVRCKLTKLERRIAKLSREHRRWREMLEALPNGPEA